MCFIAFSEEAGASPNTYDTTEGCKIRLTILDTTPLLKVCFCDILRWIIEDILDTWAFLNDFVVIYTWIYFQAIEDKMAFSPNIYSTHSFLIL